MFFLVTITVGRSFIQFFPSLLHKNDRILRNYGSFFKDYTTVLIYLIIV